LKYLLLACILLASSAALAGEGTALCQLTDKYVLARTPSGLAQFSNVGQIQIVCSVPERPFPTKPGTSLSGLKIATKAYQILADGSEKLVSSETNVTGGGRGYAPVPPGWEGADFYLHIPLEPSEQEAEIERFWKKTKDKLPPKFQTEEARRKAFERLQQFVYQHRAGRFRLECRVMDGDQVLGIGTVQFEIVFKGRFSDLGLPGFSTV